MCDYLVSDLLPVQSENENEEEDHLEDTAD